MTHIRDLDETLYGAIKTNSPDRSSGPLTLAGPSSREGYFSASALRLYRFEEQQAKESRVVLSLLGPQEEIGKVLLFTRSRIGIRIRLVGA